MHTNKWRFLLTAMIVTSSLLSVSAGACHAQDVKGLGVGNWLTFAANIPEGGYRRTQFYAPHYNIGVLQWDSRAELWLPPFRDKFSWGLYVKLAGIAQSQSIAFPNAWLGGPGIGLQLYPFSSWHFQAPGSTVGKLLGPLRLFGEYNRTNYWGTRNSWRPRGQSRVGFEYWKAVNVNEPGRLWWAEIWNGLYWQSSNEFTDRYDSVVFANAWRSGIRKPHSGAISVITPYLAIESSRTKYDFAGISGCFLTAQNGVTNPCDFFWENRLLVGGGLRFAPSLVKLARRDRLWLNRFVIYGEYLNTATYYGPAAPSSVPRLDVRFGVSASIGQWYK